MSLSACFVQPGNVYVFKAGVSTQSELIRKMCVGIPFEKQVDGNGGKSNGLGNMHTFGLRNPNWSCNQKRSASCFILLKAKVAVGSVPISADLDLPFGQEGAAKCVCVCVCGLRFCFAFSILPFSSKLGGSHTKVDLIGFPGSVTRLFFLQTDFGFLHSVQVGPPRVKNSWHAISLQLLISSTILVTE